MKALFPSQYSWRLVHGELTNQIHNQDLRLKMPPDWGSHDGVRIDNLGKRKTASRPL